MKRSSISSNGKVIYGQKWQLDTESRSSDSSESDDDRPSIIGAAKQQSPTLFTNQEQIPKGKYVVCSEGGVGELMYGAALRGDWLAAEVLLERHPNLAIDYVSEEGDRALHVAAAMRHKMFVERLLERVSDLTLVDGRGYTACCYAAVSGDLEIARLIIDKNPDLVNPDLHASHNSTSTAPSPSPSPLHRAALRGDKKMLSYLLRSAQSKGMSAQKWFDLLLLTIRGQMYDLAIEIVAKDGSITTMFNEEGTALHLLARHYIPNGNRAVDFGELPEKLWGEMQLKLGSGKLVEVMRKPHIVHDAAKAGNVKLLTMIIRTYPQLIWDTDSNGYTCFHIAVIYRQRQVFALIRQVEVTTTSQDQDGNNILHLAAKTPPLALTLNRRKLSPAFQMQSELLWFEAVEKMVPPCCVMMENKQGLKPRELFSKTHRRLLKEGELWMRNTADSGMLIATIMLTVVFAAAFTLPGGYGAQTGEPILANNTWFQVFLGCDVAAFIGSVISIMAFRMISGYHFAEDEFFYRLPNLQMIGFQGLFVSVVGASSAFISALFSFNFNMNRMNFPLWYGFGTMYIFILLWAAIEFRALYDALSRRGTTRIKVHIDNVLFERL